MSASKIHVYELHSQILEWNSMVSLSQDQVTLFEKQLAELVAKNTGKDLLAAAQSFESKFIRQREVADILLHDLKITDEQAKKLLEGNPAAAHVSVEDPAGLRDQAATYERLFKELKQDWYHLLASSL